MAFAAPIAAFFTAAAPYIAIGSTVLQAYSSIQAGNAQAAAYRAQARSAEDMARQQDLQATQISAQRLNELNANLAAIDAVRSGANVTGDSPTQATIVKSFTTESLNARDNEVLNAKLRGLSARNAARAAYGDANAAKWGGYIGAVGKLADAAVSFGGLFPSTPSKIGYRNTGHMYGPFQTGTN